MVHPSLAFELNFNHGTSVAFCGASVAFAFLQATVPHSCALVLKLKKGVVRSVKRWWPLRKRLAGDMTEAGSGTGNFKAMSGSRARREG